MHAGAVYGRFHYTLEPGMPGRGSSQRPGAAAAAVAEVVDNQNDRRRLGDYPGCCTGSNGAQRQAHVCSALLTARNSKAACCIAAAR